MRALPTRTAGPAAVTALALSIALAAASPAAAFSAGKAGFSIRANGEAIPYEVFSLFVLPRQQVPIEALGAAATRLEMTADGVAVRETAANRWTWRAPASSGLRVLRISNPGSGLAMTLHVFVLVPATEVSNERLNGYRIGTYPQRPFRGLSAYKPPRGFVEVTEANRSTRVSPHFRLEQFLCKQAGGPPRYLVLRERLLLKLEYLLSLVNGKGHRAETFAVLSGFRTPTYNRAIGNVPNSRHLWGGAADVFVDEAPRDGIMDDLDGNGTIDVNDARHLYRLFEAAAGAPEHGELTGGLGVYGSTSAHGPFVHVDARGYRARWGSR